MALKVIFVCAMRQESNFTFFQMNSQLFRIIFKVIYLYQFPRAVITNYRKPGGLKQQKCILSQFRRPEVQNQGVGRIGYSGRKHPTPPPQLLVVASNPWSSLICRHITLVSASIFPSPSSLCLCGSLLFLMRMPVIRCRAHSEFRMHQFEIPDCICKDPLSK